MVVSLKNESYALSQSDRATYLRYAALSLPRHTSYPSVPAWSESYQAADYAQDLGREASYSRPVSLYVHVPFCQKLCYYCGCNKLIIPKDHAKSSDHIADYIESLDRELSGVRSALGPAELKNVHFGGGTPTYLEPEDLEKVWRLITAKFTLHPDAEIAVEIDPRATSLAHLKKMKELGVNRLSLGVQDFDPKVQQAVNRIQSLAMVSDFVGVCRSLGFDSLNFDLIYGLPYQTLETMAETIAAAVRLAPDRIAFYRLALLPDIFRWQKHFGRADIPSGDLPLSLNLMAINAFQEAGYDYIGLDHFAKPTDGLALAHKSGMLRRNFQGMTTGGDTSIVGVGPSAISSLHASYMQNSADLNRWQRRVESGFATERGVRLTNDDVLRNRVIQDLYCYRGIDKVSLSKQFAIDFDQYFLSEMAKVKYLESEGLVQVTGQHFKLARPLGELLVRVVAAAFDANIPAQAYRVGLANSEASKVG